MKVIITGATGFLGSHLVKTFLQKGHEVIIFKRSCSKIDRLEDTITQLHAYDVDRCSITQPFAAHNNLDVVIHAATSYGRKENVSEVFEANTVFPLKLLETAVAFNVPVFINTDTFQNKHGNYNYLRSYAISKKHFAEWGREFALSQLIHFINMRLEHLYGTGDSETKFTEYIINDCLHDAAEIKLTPGRQRRDFVYIDDVVAAFLAVAEKAMSGGWHQEYEVGTGKAVTIRKFAETVRCLTGAKTVLNFGALPYRENEIMKSQADIKPLKNIGWLPKVNLQEGILKIISSKRYNLTSEVE